MHTSPRRPANRLNLLPLEDRITPATGFILANNVLIPFETDFPTLPRAAIPVQGLVEGENLVGIDFRPQNGHLYGLSSDGDGRIRLYNISFRSGIATPLTADPVFFTDGLGEIVPVTGTRFGFDFNPQADRIRVVTDTGLNFRMNPNTGKIVDGDAAMPGIQPDGPITGGPAGADGAAYTNNNPYAKVTTLYTLDTATQSLYIQNPPNSGTQTIARLLTSNGQPLEFTASGGFDITPGIQTSEANAPAQGNGLALLTVQGKTGLYGVNLNDGKTALISPIGSGKLNAQGLAISTAPAAGNFLIASDGESIIRFNSTSPGTAFSAPIQGLNKGEFLVGIDLRPATGQLYGLGVDTQNDKATLYIVDPQDGQLTPVGKAGGIAFANGNGTPVDFPEQKLGYGFDFNPTVDRIRVVTGNGLNFRINPNTGAPIDGDFGGQAGSVPGVNPDGFLKSGSTTASATAYTNSFETFQGQGVTTQYTLDAVTQKLFIQNPPNGGTLASARSVTLDGQPLNFEAVNGFDIPARVRVATANAPAVGMALAALTVAGETGLYNIDLASGAATFLGAIAAGDSAMSGLTIAEQPERRIELFAAGSGPGIPAQVRVYNPDGQIRFSLTPYESSFTGGVLVATGDVTGDGVDDIITGTGVGGGPRVRIFDGATGQPVRDFFPYEDSFRGGVLVAAGDTNGDGFAEIITGTGVGGGPRVQVFDGVTQKLLANFFAYEDTFRGGVLVAAGDITGDGKAEIITGTGVGGGPRILAFDPVSLLPVANFFAYEDSFRGGVFVSAGDLNGNGVSEIIAGTGQGGGPRVLAFDMTSPTPTIIADFFAFDQAFRGGVRVSTVDRDANGADEVLTATGPGIANRLLMYAAGGSLVADLRPFDSNFDGGVFVG